MTRDTYAFSATHALMTWYVRGNEYASSDHGDFDLTISAGINKDGFFCGVNVYGPSVLSSDLLRRAAFFQEVVGELGLSKEIAVSMNSGVLRMAAQPPWRLWFPSAKVNGGDPGGFHVRGFLSIDAALSSGNHLVQRFAKKMVGVSFTAKLPHESYKSVFAELNTLWHPWDVDVKGSLTSAAVDILKGGEVSTTSLLRIPAFEWYGARGWAAYGSIVVEGGQRFLEIAAEGAAAEQLNERIAFLDDLNFEFIEQDRSMQLE